MANLSLFLLGAFQATLDGARVAGFESVKARALLAYLAVEADRPHSRERLAGLLWPNRPEKTARSNLRHTLVALRTAIGDKSAVPPFLSITRETIQFNRGSDYWLDVETFRALAEANPEERSTIRQLEEAVSLYRGSFLEGFSVEDSPAFEDWSLLMRERLQRQVSAVLQRLVREYEELGEVKHACEYAWHRVELEPWQEEAHQCLMRLLALSGQRSAALAQYGACRRILAKELDVEPTEETTRLYEEILNGDLAAQESETRERKPHHFPVPLTPLVGRETELAEVTERLQDQSCRLLTLVGPGGSGKTRLALEAASGQIDRFSHGVYFVSLASLQAVDAIVPTIAQSLGLSFYGEEEPKEQLLNYLCRKKTLLVLDNFEHLLNGAGLVTEILEKAPDVTVLTTSRARLSVRGEHRLPIAGMDVPELTPSVSSDAAQSGAVKLFLAGARRAQPDFELTDDNLVDVVRICHQVEGMPLGILLASAWVEMLHPSEIAAEIASQLPGRGLDFLETDLRDVPVRQRSMRAVFDHSWSLLTKREREAMQALSVFRGGCTREAALQVTGASLRELRALVTKSLLHRAPTGRYEMHELLRLYAAEKLSSSRDTEKLVHDEHCAYYCAALQGWGADLKGSWQQTALVEIDAEIGNALAAWDWAAEHQQASRLEQAIDGLCRYYLWRGRYIEGESACRTAEAELAVPEPHGMRALAKVLAWRGILSNTLGHRQAALQLLQQSLDLVQRPELADWDTRADEAFALLHMGNLLAPSDLERAECMCRQSLALYEATGDQWQVANALDALAYIARHSDNYSKARRLFEQSLAIRQSLGDLEAISASLVGLSHVAMEHEWRFEESERLMREAIAIRRETRFQTASVGGLENLGQVLIHQGKFAQAHVALEESAAIGDDLGSPHHTVINTIMLLAVAKMHLGQYEQARICARESLAFAQEIGHQHQIESCLRVAGYIALAEGDYGKARQLLQESIRICREVGLIDGLSWSLATLTYVPLALGQISEAKGLLPQALQIVIQTRTALPSMATLPPSALFLAHLGETEQAVELYALASRYPYVANSRFFYDMAGQHIEAAAATLPADAVHKAQERGRARDLEATVKELLAEFNK